MPAITAHDLVKKMMPAGSRGQIIGPHGSGKSTLISQLVDMFRAAGLDVQRFTQRDRQRWLEIDNAKRRGWNEHTLVIVDGYEQLAWWERWRIRRSHRRQGHRLLVTAHADQGMPTLWQTSSSVALLQRIVDQLTIDLPVGRRPTACNVRAAFESHQGNIREALFHLYDVAAANSTPAC